MSDASYRVFGLDRAVYGPVSLESLREWARDGRVLRETWIHVEVSGREAWRRAEDMDELEGSFSDPTVVEGVPDGVPMQVPAATRSGVQARVLGRLKLFADMSPEEMEPFARVMIQEVHRPFSFVVRQGSHGDAMYFVVEGRVGVSTRGQVAESYLVSMNIGETFGEMSLFDPGPRSADVRAENEVTVLVLTSEALSRICQEAPAAANRFLLNVARLLASRVRAMDRRAANAKDLDATVKSGR